MAEYHVGCGAFGIYAGTLNSRNKNMWQTKLSVQTKQFVPSATILCSNFLVVWIARKRRQMAMSGHLKMGGSLN